MLSERRWAYGYILLEVRLHLSKMSVKSCTRAPYVASFFLQFTDDVTTWVY